MRFGISFAAGITAVGIGLITSGLAGQASAQQITPTQVHQVVSAANSQLEALTTAYLLDVPANKTENLTPRRPRHVFQKARAAFELLQTLRRLNGLAANALPAIPGRDLKPADVKQMVDVLRSDTDALAATFGLPASVLPDDSSKRSPTDVYAALSRYMQLLINLDVPPPLPNDVYRVANTITSVATEIGNHLQLADMPEMSQIGNPKKPGDVYRRGADILVILRNMNGEGKRINLPAGVISPNLKTSGITPAVVNDLLGMVLADLVVAKAQLGITTDTAFAPPVGGKTPTHVFERLETAHVILSAVR